MPNIAITYPNEAGMIPVDSFNRYLRYSNQRRAATGGAIPFSDQKAFWEGTMDSVVKGAATRAAQNLEQRKYESNVEYQNRQLEMQDTASKRAGIASLAGIPMTMMMYNALRPEDRALPLFNEANQYIGPEGKLTSGQIDTLGYRNQPWWKRLYQNTLGERPESGYFGGPGLPMETSNPLTDWGTSETLSGIPLPAESYDWMSGISPGLDIPFDYSGFENWGSELYSEPNLLADSGLFNWDNFNI